MLQPKRLISLLLALVLVSSLLPAAVFAQDTCAHHWEWDGENGSFLPTCTLCSEALTEITGPAKDGYANWTLTSDGTLTVTGAGVFADDDLTDYASHISALVIGPEVTKAHLNGSRFTSLASITVDERNSRLKAVDNVLFDVETQELVLYPCKKTDSSYTVPGCSIGSYAFYNNSYLESLVVGEGTLRIDGSAISRCENLTELSLPASLEEVWASAIPDSVETIYYAGNETMWNRVYLHPDNDLSGAELVFGMPKSGIVPQWKNAHTLLQLKGEAEDAALVVVSFYHSDGQLVKSLTYSPAQVAAGVNITDNTVDLSACSAKIMVVNEDFAPVYDYTVPEGDVDPTTTAVFEGWLYQTDRGDIQLSNPIHIRPGELFFSDGEQSLVLDSAGVSTPGHLGLGQKYIVTYNVQTNDLISMESAGVSEVGTARLDEVSWERVTVGNAEKYLFTFGELEALPLDSDAIPRATPTSGSFITPAELRDLAGSPCADEYTAVDKDGDGDIDYLLVRPVQYGRVESTGEGRYGDYMTLQIAGEHANQTTRYWLEELDGPAKLPNHPEEGDIVKLTCGFEDSQTSWEILPVESMTLDGIAAETDSYTFDDRTFTAAQNGWDLTDILIEDKVGDPFTVAYDGDLLVWAEADVIPLDVTEIYTDGDEIEPEAKDAVELMYALDLMGAIAESPEPEELVLLDAAGSFNPNGTFTRAEMARLAYLILHSGDDDGAVNYKGASTFSDVEADAWYEGYINYCTANKLIHGKNDGTFAPDEPVTCAKAVKILLTVLGYPAAERGYTPDNADWETVVLTDAATAGLLYKFTYSTAGTIPRQWVAKLVENALLNAFPYVPEEDEDTEPVTIGETFFGLTEDSETYRSVYPEEPVITVTAGLEELESIGPDVFQDYLEETLDSTKYEVSHVVFQDAPASAAKGYLYTNGKKLTSARASFYMDPTSSQYDLEDLHYLAGDKTGHADATFTLYYIASASTKTQSLQGIIRFRSVEIPTGEITVTEPVPAARALDFADELEQFEALGGNSNAYITIDTLPACGRLVYNWGTTEQEAVETGMQFYLSGTAKRLFSHVSYVPAYSSDKTARTDTFAVTGFSAEGNKVKGTVTVTVAHALQSAHFTDVTDSYYADSVDFVYNQQISTGMTTNTFGLTGGMTRGQFVTFLYRAAGSPAVTDATNNFTDVSASDYYYNPIMWAVRNDLVTGVTATTFAPTDSLTREQALTFLYRLAMNYLGRDGTLGSTDGITDYADVDAWAQTPVRWAAGHGFICDGALEPKATLDRGTTALYLHGALTGIAGSTGGGTPAPDPEPTPDPEPVARTVLAYAISATTASGALEVQVIGPDGEQDALFVTEVDGEAPSVTGFALPAFYQAAENAAGEASLTLISGDFAEQGIYAGTVTKYVGSSNSIHLDDDDQTLLASADTFTLYDGNLDVESDTLEDVTKKTNYIFFAPDETVVYAVDASSTALNGLFVRLGGLNDSAAKYGDSYFIHPEARDAVAFLYDIDLMKGNDKGNFNPEGTVTRAELAKMIYVILNYGKDDKGADYTDLNLFTDVASADWYAGYVNYCAAMGLMSGKADGTFAPYDTVTCPQVAKILLMALGYDAEHRGYVGANWDKNVLSDAAILGLLDGYEYNVNTVAPRQWLAVMLANALRSCYTYVGDDPVRFTTLVIKDTNAIDRKIHILTGDKYYDLGLDPAPQLVLLTDAYCGTTRTGVEYAADALLDGKIVDMDVSPDSDYALFIDDDSESNNNWGHLIPYAGDENAATNVAAYTLDEDGVMHLYQTEKTFIDLYEADLNAGQMTYYGDYTDENGELFQNIKVQASKDTVFCYADDEGSVFSVTGYQNSYAVIDSDFGIRAVYAVATNASSEGEDPYFVADMIVIETEHPVNQPAPEKLTLLTDAYYEQNRTGVVYAVDALLDGKIVDMDVSPDQDYALFIDDSESSNNWGHLIPYAGDENAATNVAAYTLDEDGVMHLYQTEKTFIDLYEADLNAGQMTYYGDYTDENGELFQNIKVQANKDTVFCYADTEGTVLSVTHYKESYNVFDDVHGIRAMYAVATNTAGEGEDPYFVASMIVVETDVSVLTPKVSVVLGYDGTYYADKAYTHMDAVDSDGAQVTLVIGEDESSGFSGADMVLPAFYVNTEQADGDHLPVLITDGNYKANGIYAVTVDRVNALYDYIVTTDGDELTLTDTTPVYHLYAADSSTELTNVDEYGDALALQSGSSYILYTENDEVVYALLVENADDPAAALYTRISGKALSSEPRLVLGYNVVNKTVTDYISLDILTTDCTEDVLAVTQLDGENAADAVFDLPNFFLSAETADGDASLTSVTAGCSDYGIYAATVDRVNALYDYIVTTDGDELTLTDTTPVYHLYAADSSTELTNVDEYGDALALQSGSSYILYTENDEVVYALLVEDGADIAAPLFTAISGRTLEQPVDPDQQMEEAAAAIAKITSVQVADGKWSTVKAAIVSAINAVDNVTEADVTATVYEALSSGSIGTVTITGSYKVAGQTVELPETTITVIVA